MSPRRQRVVGDARDIRTATRPSAASLPVACVRTQAVECAYAHIPGREARR
jgi:hypothetical protein